MSNVRAIPEGLHSVTPALTLSDCAAALEFYKKAFGALEIQRAGDPSGKKVWHAQIRIGDSAIFANDEFPEMASGARPMNLWIYGDDVDGRFKRAVDAGAKPVMPPADMFWGDRMAKVIDPWGNDWTLAQHVKDLTPAEMKAAQDAAIAELKKEKK